MMFALLLFLVSEFSMTIGAQQHHLLSSSTLHTCVVMMDRRSVRCWGSEALGPGLGYGVGDVATGMPGTDGRIRGIVDVGDVPLNLPSGDTVLSVCTGLGFSCVLFSSGAAECWGANDFGQLGLGDTNERAQPAGAVPGGSFSGLACGYSHVCAVDQAGSNVVCWGSNSSGQSGHSSLANATVIRPTPVALAWPNYTAVAVSAGQEHTCALVLASGNHHVVCWGNNVSGQCGYQLGGGGNILDDPASLSGVPGLSPAAVNVLTAGGQYNCVVYGLAGQVACWGKADDGRVGYGGLGVVTGNVSVAQSDRLAIDAVNPISVGSAPVVALAAGSRHTLMADAAGRVRGWGAIAGGRLGVPGVINIGDAPGRLPDTGAYVRFPPGTRIVAVSAGFSHSCCLSDEGEVFCFGQAGSGLGYNATTNVGDQPGREPVDVGPVPLGGPAAHPPPPPPPVTAAPRNGTASMLMIVPEDPPADGNPLPWWFWLILLLALCFLTLLVFFLLYRVRKRRQESANV